MLGDGFRLPTDLPLSEAQRQATISAMTNRLTLVQGRLQWIVLLGAVEEELFLKGLCKYSCPLIRSPGYGKNACGLRHH